MKKKILPLIASFATIFAVAQTPCDNGTAGSYPCNGYDLQSHFSLSDMNAGGGNDSWGWTDPDNGDEFALVGLDNGTAFIDISDPINPVYLGKLPTETSSSIWRDIKVYNNYAFIVSEAGGHGMQIFDLTRLRDVTNAPETFTNDAYYNGIGGVHNIVINEESGYAYSVGGGIYGGGPHFINIQDPLNPVGEGGYSGGGYTHDAQVVIYNGPDSDYTGHEIYFGSNANHVEIVDVTDKSNPIQIKSFNYPTTGYTHQNWITEDHKYMLLGDEGDEFDFGFNTRTVVFDLTDLDNPQLHYEYFGPNSSVDHNLYVVGDKFYLANYSSGLRVIDISNIDNGGFEEIGYFDTYVPNNNASYNGSWNVYPFFESGNIVISGDNGFTLVKAPEILAVSDNDFSNFTLFPNPAHNRLTINSKLEPITQIEIFNVLGQRVKSFTFTSSISESIDISSLMSGLYLVKINNNTTKRLIVK
ncbi:MAG: choice-of-anchor B family protein [Flavobacteriaceae bacterium]